MNAIRQQYHSLLQMGRTQDANQVKHELEAMLLASQHQQGFHPTNVKYSAEGNRM